MCSSEEVPLNPSQKQEQPQPTRKKKPVHKNEDFYGINEQVHYKGGVK